MSYINYKYILQITHAEFYTRISRKAIDITKKCTIIIDVTFPYYY